METLQHDVEPFGITTTTIIEPGFFRTELLVEGASTVWAPLSIDDYAERTKKTIAQWKSMNGQQGGPRQARRRARHDRRPGRQGRCAGWPARTPWPAPRARPTTCSTGPTPTPSCPRTSTTNSTPKPGTTHAGDSEKKVSGLWQDRHGFRSVALAPTQGRNDRLTRLSPEEPPLFRAGPELELAQRYLSPAACPGREPR